MMKLYYTKEPGTWIMFAIAFITGSVKSGSLSPATLVVFVSLTLFLMAKGPVAGFLKKKDKNLIPSIFIYVLIGSAGSIYSILIQPYLITLYSGSIILIIIFFIFGRMGFPLLAEACGMAIMGLVAGISASLGKGIIPNLYLCLMFFVFYLASSFRVRFTIRRYRLISGVYSTLIVFSGVVMALKGRLVFLSFMPLVEDIYAALTGKRDDFKRLGIIETIKSVIFALILLSYQY